MKIVQKIVKYIKLGGVGYLLGEMGFRFFYPFKKHLNQEFFFKMIFFLKQGYWPNLVNPRSLNEKVLYRMLRNFPSFSAVVADKWAVREYVKNKGCEEILTNVLWVGKDVENIPFDTLPNRFVIKANHGSGWNILVRDKDKADRQGIVKECRKWLSRKFSDNLGESHYDGIEPKIIIEEFLSDGGSDVPLDYKIFCFDGVVHGINVDFDRYAEHTRLCYDRDWNEMPYALTYPKRENRCVPRPKKLEDMITYAEKISEGFDFCRVDLYLLNDGRIYFGEITLTPGAAHDRYFPKEWDFKTGELWNLDLENGPREENREKEKRMDQATVRGQVRNMVERNINRK